MAEASPGPLAPWRGHWPEYLIEGWALGSFMLSASVFTVLLESPALRLRPRSPDRPGIEFLDYRMPPGGRPAPVGTRSDDVVHVHLVLLVADFDEQIQTLEENHVRFVSTGVVTFADGSRAAMVCDPDGHALLLEDRPFGP